MGKQELIKTINKFIHVKSGQILTLDLFGKIKKDLEDVYSISSVNIYYEQLEDNKVDLKLSLTTETDKLIHISGGYEFVYDKYRMDQYMHYLEGISPVIFMYSHPNFFKKGLVEFDLLSVFGMQWDASMSCNLYEKVQFNFGLNSWVVPFGNQFTDYSIQKINKADLVYLNLNPYFEIGKKFSDHKIGVFFTYTPNFIFMMPEEYPLNEVDNASDFLYPADFFVEHKIGFKFEMDYITVLETNLVRKGFKIKAEVDWIKNTPDIEWGYRDNLNLPSFTSFLFYFYFEYSNYVNDLFYFSFGFHYKGGIDLYKNQLITIDKGIMGLPFDSMMKVHGLSNNKFTAEHMMLFNSIFGFKVHEIFHLGMYLDACSFFEKNADTYLFHIDNTAYYNNMIFGYGCFFKWIPYRLLVLTLEVSFSHEPGQNVIRVPVIGFHIAKTFINPKINRK